MRLTLWNRTPSGPTDTPPAGRHLHSRRLATVLALVALAVFFSGCVIQTTPTGYDVTYRVTKDAAAFVNSIEYRDSGGTLRTVNNPSLPWQYAARFDFGSSLFVGASADGSPSAAATLELTATRASGGAAAIDQTAVCTRSPCTPSDFYIDATLSTSAVTLNGLGTDAHRETPGDTP